MGTIKGNATRKMGLMTRASFLSLTGWSVTGILLQPLISFANYKTMEHNKDFDVIIIGGSYAGLSAAMSLGRSLRNVLIIDSGKTCNRYTPHSHNFIPHDGEEPSVLAKKAKEQVLKYKTVDFFEGLAVKGQKTDTGFRITTQSGKVFSAPKLIVATGIKDIFPAIKGFEECWGKTVIHCPYCHGYEFKGEKTAIMANGDKAFHLATLISNLTDDISIITSGKAAFNTIQEEKLAKHRIKIIEMEIDVIEHDKGHIKALLFKDGSRELFSAMYAALPFEQHSDIPVSLGCALTETGHIKTDMFQKTTVNGVFACGDNAAMMRSVANAVGSGNITGAIVNAELAQEQF